MLDFIKKWKIVLAISLIGAIGGFSYYYFVGCKSGTCPINSNPYYSTIWGSVMGYLIGDLLNERIKKRSKK